MKLQLSRAILVAIVFVAISLVSLTYATVEAINYGSYWDARSQLTSNVNRLHVETSSTNGSVTIQTTVSATNPTDYSGMMVRYFELRLYFVKLGSNQTLFSGDSAGEIIDLISTDNAPVGNPIGPHSTLISVLTLHLSPSRSDAFKAFYQANPAQVYGQTEVRAAVDSFLDTVLGPEIVQNDQTVPIS